MNQIARHAHSRIEEALGDTRVVVIQGARQVGKSTLAEQITRERGGVMVSLDDQPAYDLAKSDPASFLRQNPDGLLTIDEVQRVPELVLALKANVDRDTRPGRFLITGSANLLHIRATGDSLAGRAEDVSLYGFSQGELTGHKETFVDRLLAGDRFLGHTSNLTRADYLERAIAGSYPEALARNQERRRKNWYNTYLRRIIDRDADEVSRLHMLSSLPQILRYLAAQNSSELNMARIAQQIHMPASTLKPYIDLLETLYLIKRIPAWRANLYKRVVSKPKVSLLDTGLAAHLLNVNARGTSPPANPEIAGPLIEGFVTGEILRHLSWAEEYAELHHLRDHDGAEVDLILETNDGRVAGIEVKTGSTVGSGSSRWLAQLRDKLGERFVGGIILSSRENSISVGDRITNAPIDVLWSR